MIEALSAMGSVFTDPYLFKNIGDHSEIRFNPNYIRKYLLWTLKDVGKLRN